MADMQPEMNEVSLMRRRRQKEKAAASVHGGKEVAIIKSEEIELDRVSTDSSDDNQEDDDADVVRKNVNHVVEGKAATPEELYFLRSQVQDLQGALKARDMELFQLRERYDLLLVAVEQQDEAIAAIYATTNMSSSEAQLLQYSALRESSMQSTTPPPCLKRTAKEMLLGHLDTMGFDATSVGTVLDTFHDTTTATSNATSATANSATTELAALNSALDQLLYADTSTGPAPPAPVVPAYANTSGFLRPAVRRHSSRRLSVSDFGLLSHESSSSSEQQHEAGGGTPTRRLSDPLFAGLDDITDTSNNSNNSSQFQANLKQRADMQNSDEVEELSYSAFLERLSLPGSKDIVECIRRFVGSVLGPRGDGCPPTSAHFVDYIFYGHESFQPRCEDFFRSIDDTLASHPAWRHAPERTLRHARDGIEKYVMDKLADVPLHRLPSSAVWKAEDAALSRRMHVLAQVVTPDMLDIKPSMRNEVVWSIAQDELRRINDCRSPGDKINCIVRCCSIIFSVLNLARGGDALSRPGADDFLPVFIYLVLHSQVPNLVSNAEYIAAYRTPADLMSK
ncbi:hypothetical protein B5M09_007916 [Aphanomyces astaci]|uniref:VPS9 domain-containing protein n=1 Tax=Aphanomyces astaci TaxID=112090 RepID=A0A425D6N9_APHAT|nr:hypothetical protein B5M09_007916 [Aphanomyces astaci]